MKSDHRLSRSSVDKSGVTGKWTVTVPFGRQVSGNATYEELAVDASQLGW